MTAKKWDVWSLDRKTLAGLVVNEGITEREATADAEHRNATAVRLKMPGTAFVALPQGRQPAQSDLPPLPAAEMAAAARNKNPLHNHEDVDAGLWTADTMAAHLQFLHGVDDLPEERSLMWLLEVHDGLSHGTSAEKGELDRRSAGEPEPEPGCRYSRIYWGKLRTSDNPADKDLYLESDNGTSIVCFAPGDVQALRAAVLPETEGLKALQDIWSANLGPGGRRAVEAGHAAGYRLGVDDMENTPAYRTAPVDVIDVIGFLTGLAGTAAAIRDGKLDALGTVVEFLEQVKARTGDEADRG
jgi:hypothetical protein